ncbi:hypothetical protein MKEN_00223800 [Mycena kentingensis (nom. inval.)]|nr:hypothetical protein MKEN_00223800 [Mycena kentingensis (nom. inval.)]
MRTISFSAACIPTSLNQQAPGGPHPLREPTCDMTSHHLLTPDTAERSMEHIDGPNTGFRGISPAAVLDKAWRRRHGKMTVIEATSQSLGYPVSSSTLMIETQHIDPQKCLKYPPPKYKGRKPRMIFDPSDSSAFDDFQQGHGQQVLLSGLQTPKMGHRHTSTRWILHPSIWNLRALPPQVLVAEFSSIDTLPYVRFVGLSVAPGGGATTPADPIPTPSPESTAVGVSRSQSDASMSVPSTSESATPLSTASTGSNGISQSAEATPAATVSIPGEPLDHPAYKISTRAIVGIVCACVVIAISVAVFILYRWTRRFRKTETTSVSAYPTELESSAPTTARRKGESEASRSNDSDTPVSPDAGGADVAAGSPAEVLLHLHAITERMAAFEAQVLLSPAPDRPPAYSG